MNRKVLLIALIVLCCVGFAVVRDAVAGQCPKMCGTCCEWPNCEMWLCYDACWQCADGCTGCIYDSSCYQLLCAF